MHILYYNGIESIIMIYPYKMIKGFIMEKLITGQYFGFFRYLFCYKIDVSNIFHFFSIYLHSVMDIFDVFRRTFTFNT